MSEIAFVDKNNGYNLNLNCVITGRWYVSPSDALWIEFVVNEGVLKPTRRIWVEDKFIREIETCSCVK